ncbi:hypothetical protein HanXRQr2_Chr01g0035761 [Helianthus annuus]|uniref:Uncharacterized protein n=1 Tax=Helianthus annuus TaxID=4232 RepID=A0A9K3JXI9_HELAN|nr:hypothetical protein HanXRQr2_Chr01g0035761 [Helianthus annuus]
MRGAPCGVRPLGSLPCGVRPLGSLPCGVRRCGSSLSMRRAAVQLKSVHAACATSPCESIRARHTVAPYWLTLVRRTRHSRTHAPCSEPRASCTRARMTATSCTASPTTWSLQPLCFTTRARSKIQRRLSSGSRRCERAKCKVRHQSATLRLIAHATRARASVCECECELGCSAPFARTLVCASMKQ